MELYDIFLKKKHSDRIRSILQQYNRNILLYLLSFFPKSKKISLLEIGPGKGYFYFATCEWKNRISYSAFDQNKKILHHLHIHSMYQGKAPLLPRLDKKFDIIYAAFVVEHLKNGEEVFQFINQCKRHLNPDGLIVFLTPDVRKQGFEFWNSDYTHSYPTSKRNVTMAFFDNHLTHIWIKDFTDIAIWITHVSVLWRWISLGIKIIMVPYNYHFLHLLTGLIYKKSEYHPESIFYRLYLFTKVDSLMFIAQK